MALLLVHFQLAPEPEPEPEWVLDSGVTFTPTPVQPVAEPIKTRSKEIDAKVELPLEQVESQPIVHEKPLPEEKTDWPDANPIRYASLEPLLDCIVRPCRSTLKVSPASEEKPAEPPTEAAPIQGQNKPPAYPRIARLRGWEGAVGLVVQVSEDGRPVEIAVESASGHEVLDETAVAAVREWRFTPARRNGRPISSTLRFMVRFVLAEENR